MAAMIHFLALSDEAESAPCPEVLARIAGLKNALRLVDGNGGGPAGDIDDGCDWAISDAGIRRCFDRRSERAIAGIAAGLEVVVHGSSAEHMPNDASLALLACEIRGTLADLSSLVRGAQSSRALATPAPSPWG